MLFYLAFLCGAIGFSMEIKALKVITYTCMGILFVYIYIKAWKLIIGSYRVKEWGIAIIGTLFATVGLGFVACMLSDVVWGCPCW